MRKPWWLVLGCMVAAGPLGADWKITTVTTDMRGEQSVRTEYYKDNLRRSDVQLSGKLVYVGVLDFENLRRTGWDPSAKQYTVDPLAITFNRAGISAQAENARPEVIWVESVTRDTGERKLLFDRMARHLITSEKRSREEPVGSGGKLESEMVRDGWYVGDPELPKEVVAGGMYVLSVNGQAPTVKASHSGPVVSGLAIREKVSLEGAGPKYESETEVTELYKGVLLGTLFEPPSGYKRVAHLRDGIFLRQLSISDEIEMYWNSFENWLLSWFS